MGVMCNKTQLYVKCYSQTMIYRKLNFTPIWVGEKEWWILN